jgi:hypothetical protein
MVTSVKSIDDARHVLREAAANPDDKAALRSLLKETRLLLDPEDDERRRGCGGEGNRTRASEHGARTESYAFMTRAERGLISELPAARE